jgi:hypothetical protein
MEKQLFDELVMSLRQAADVICASKRTRKTGRRLAERIRKVRQAVQMASPRAFKKKRLTQYFYRARELPKPVARRRKFA